MKQAALCAMRVIRKVPELMDHFISRSTSLLSDKNHGVLHCGITLVTDMCAIDEETLQGFRKVSHVGTCIRGTRFRAYSLSGLTCTLQYS